MSLFGKPQVIVVSVRSGAPPVPAGYTLVMVDRTTPLGNKNQPSRHPVPSSERDDLIRKYAVDLSRDLAIGGPMSAEVDRLVRRVAGGEYVALGCWCRPKRCHADVIQREVAARVRRYLIDDFDRNTARKR